MDMKSKIAAPLVLLLLGATADASSLSPRPPSSPARFIHADVAAGVDRRPLLRSFRPPLGWSLRPLSVRGGGALDVSDLDEEEYDSDEEELSENEMSNLEIDSEDDEEEEEKEEEEEEKTSSPSSPSSGPPVKVSIKTALQSPLIDQHLEFAASRRRTVQSLKQAVSKTMRGRPPLSCIQIKYQGRTLDDEETVDDLSEEMDEDDEEEEESDVGEDDEDAVRLNLTCDIVPPVDAKFGIEFREKVTKMSTKEIFEAYCLNMAGMTYGQELQAREGDLYEIDSKTMDHVENGEDEEEGQLSSQPMTEAASNNHSLNIRKKAALIQKQFESTLSSDTLRLMEEEHERVRSSSENVEVVGVGGDEKVIYGLTHQGSDNAARRGRKGKTLKGGAAMNVKRALQRNLNVNWADTTRNSLLFLFFGYFGGRNSFSRTFLLLSSPLCFLVQTRPAKVAMKQLFYTIGEPPGILLSLLPAPQQAIMSLDYGETMRALYGEGALSKGGSEDGWLGMEPAEEEEGAESSSVGADFGFEDKEYDQYQYDGESQYDSDDEEY
eukprot:CAMPEP_0172553282 /NCGR_PEP_ID=MMETSP1067-20121228/49842_1 /TAXON_ID=265564 ORGANISM="Thalassiosira punctigera, Strain Tpunct2005C2" /NCGR_SAMPLE_ID=MMETSP1067 /ASSEMBLY_ACC=CAM_ASM_000444 /LENGTH=549 /DNA_ID=CAMNT_0013341443 /DNA_START=72 /DNA_END=1721 /DNA_ORIENTATION=-